jgi:tyrosine-protein kinase Etk/Wzc
MEKQMSEQQIQPYDQFDDDEINLIDLIYPIYKRRKFLIIFCLVITFMVGVISVFSQKTYEATAVILPEASEGGDTGVRAAFLEQFGVAGIGGSQSTPAALFEAVLKSNDLSWEVLKRYDYFLINGISKGGEEKVAKSFAGLVQVSKSRNDPSISISMRSNDPIFAADMANSYVWALDEYNLKNSYTSARRLREYIENRLTVAEEELDRAQKDLRAFQEKNKAVSIGKQTESTLEVLAEMESKKVELEVERAAKEKFVKEPHIELEQLNAQIEAVNKNIDRLTYSEESQVPIKHEEGKVDFYIPLTRIPALNYDESKLLLKVKAKTGVITMLTTQLEQAKLDEAKDIPTINMLEPAVPPRSPVKPRIKLNVILSFVVSLFLGIFLIFLMEFTRRLDKDPESAPKWQEIKRGFSRLIPSKENILRVLEKLKRWSDLKRGKSGQKL